MYEKEDVKEVGEKEKEKNNAKYNDKSSSIDLYTPLFNPV